MKTGNSGVLRTIPLVLFAILLCPFAYGNTIYVDDDAIGANNGTSWSNAYVYLQEALAEANAAEKPVEIHVAQGVYKPNGGLVAIPEFDWRTTTFQLINGVTLKGGYAGSGEADPNARDIGAYETILSGDLNGDDVEAVNPEDLHDEPARADNSYNVVTGSSTNETAVLDGFTIIAGNANDSRSPDSLSPHDTGGGMRNESGSPTVTNCTFTGNSSSGWGGGMWNDSGSSVVSNCKFSKNSSDYGGGMYNQGSSPILTNCTFTGNIAIYHGGGIFNWTNSSPILSNCKLSNNRARYDGGGMGNSASSSILANCIFTGNSADRNGGGMFNSYSNLSLSNCTFAENSAQNGNALAFDFLPWEEPSNLALINCILWDGGNEIWNNDGSIINITYSNVQAMGRSPSWTGEGNINAIPHFVDPATSDYHLKSQYGRWDPNSESWVVDEVTSPCVDAGDPNSSVGDEPEPNGGRVNRGAYGGTAEASKSGDLWWFETTQGAIVAEGLGVILPHEHIFTDLRGPGTRDYGQADAADVVRVMAPLLEEAKQKGVGILFECSSIGVGRNVSILSEVSAASGLPVVVPTGVYGRANFAPVEHKNMSEDELTELFISEIRQGIDSTAIKAGFIKIATGGSNMTALEEKFLRAAGRAARETGAAVASHTTTSNNVTRQVDILESISPDIRFIWVHAQSVNNRSLYRQLAERGVFIEFDSLGWNPGQDSTFITAIKDLLAAGYGEQILLSHDAGWYQPGEQNGGTQMPYTYLIETFIPKLRDNGVDDEAIRMITEINPIRAFGFNQDVNP